MMNPRFLSTGNTFSTGSGDLLRWLMWLWLGCALVSIVVCQRSFYTQGRYGKRQESEGQSLFWSGSRYGRSDADEKNTKFMAKAVEVSPRVDRFFMGSRYGKRVPTNSLQIPSNLNRFEIALDYLKRIGQLKNKNEIGFDVAEDEIRTGVDFGGSAVYVWIIEDISLASGRTFSLEEFLAEIEKAENKDEDEQLISMENLVPS